MAVNCVGGRLMVHSFELLRGRASPQRCAVCVHEWELLGFKWYLDAGRSLIHLSLSNAPGVKRVHGKLFFNNIKIYHCLHQM